MAEDDRPERSGCRRTGLQALRPSEPVGREEGDLLSDLRRGGGECLVVVQLEPEHARGLRGAEPAGVQHSERDRHLPEDVTRLPLADHALDAVDDPEHVEPALEDAEQRPRVTLVHGELAGNESDVRHHPGEPVAFGRLEVREHRDAADLLCRHHETASAAPLRPGRFIRDQRAKACRVPVLPSFARLGGGVVTVELDERVDEMAAHRLRPEEGG